MRVPVEQRRRALAEAGLRVIARDGVAAATTRAVVAEAGMSLASFHYAYRSRDELLREVVRLVVAGEREVASAVLDASGVEGAGTGPEALAALVGAGLRAYLASVEADPGREQGMLELTFAALRTPELDGVAAEQYAQYRGLVVDLLTAAATATGMRWTRPVDELARTVVALSDGLTIAALVEPGTDTGAAGDVIVPALLAHAVPDSPPDPASPDIASSDPATSAPSERTPA